MDQKTILVVEDEAALSKMITKKLESVGFATLKAESVVGALDVLEKKRVDALWLDHYLMGDKNGLDMVVQMKGQKGKLKELPIFVISDVAGPEEVKTYNKLGVSKCYLKSGTGLGQLVGEFKKFFANPKYSHS